MFRPRTNMILAGLVVFAAAALAQAAPPPAENLFPDSTKGFVSVPNIDKLVDQFNKTPAGRILMDEKMQPFRKDLERQLSDREAQLEDTLGVQLKDLRGVVTGELGLGVVRTQLGKAAILLTGDVTGNPAGAQQLLQKIGANLQQRGATATTQAVGGTTLMVYNIPESKKHPAGMAVYFVKDGLLVLGEDIASVASVHNRLTGQSRDGLATVPAYVAVVQRCTTSLPQLEAHLSWFIEPLGLAEAVRASFPNKRIEGQDLLKLAKGQGAESLRGVGGLVTMSSAPYGLLHRTAVYAPKPFTKSMQMLEFPNGTEFTPPAWVPANIGTYTSFYWNVQTAFDNFGYLFDAMFGEGEEGVWIDVLDSLETDPDGPQINIRKELIAHLGHRAVVISDNVKPIGPFSQRRLLGLQVNDEAQVTRAMEKVFKNDPQVVPHSFEANGKQYIIYEIIPEEEAVPQQQKKDDLIARKQEAPNSAVTVGHGCLFVSSHISLIEEVLTNPAAAQSLTSDGPYQEVMSQIPRLGLAQLAVQGFARNSTKFEVTYEMFRQGKLPEADTPLARILNSALEVENEEGPRKPRLDGSKLPEWEAIRHMVGAGGTIVTSEPNGWFAIGFTLDNGARAASARRP